MKGAVFMKFKTLFTLVFTFCILFFAIFSSTIFSSTAEDIAQELPCAFLPTDSYEFASVVDGAIIMHDYVIQNRGNAPLKILKVKGG